MRCLFIPNWPNVFIYSTIKSKEKKDISINSLVLNIYNKGEGYV